MRSIAKYAVAFLVGIALGCAIPVSAQQGGWERPARIAAQAQKQKTTPEIVNPDPFNASGQQAQAPTTPPQKSDPPIIVQAPASSPVTVTTKDPGWAELILPNILQWVLAAMGLSLSPTLLRIANRALVYVGTRLEVRLREKLETIVENGVAASQAQAGSGQANFLNHVVGYVREHAKDTFKRLGTDPNSGEADTAIVAIAKKLFQRGKFDFPLPPENPQVSGVDIEDRIAAAVAAALKATGVGNGHAPTNPAPFQDRRV